MPIWLKMSLDSESALAVWKIEADDQAHFDALPLGEVDKTRLQGIAHPQKKREFLGARAALNALNMPLTLLDYTDKKKPILPEVKLSLSHNHHFAAAIVHPRLEVGIDVEDINRRVSHLRHKFVRPDEQTIVESHPAFGDLLIWGSKECAYKLNGRKELDFKHHLKLSQQPNEQLAVQICDNEQMQLGGIQFLVTQGALVVWAIEQKSKH